MEKISDKQQVADWVSPVPRERWDGFRRELKGIEAFASLENFKRAQMWELVDSLTEHERSTLGRLLKRGQKMELENFIRTHGANPLFDPQADLELSVDVATADVVNLATPATAQANQAILNGEVVHVLFQAGEASRFEQGPFYHLNPIHFAKALENKTDVGEWLQKIDRAASTLPPSVQNILLGQPLGPKQGVMIRAALRRVIEEEIRAGRLQGSDAPARYHAALKAQKLIFFVSSQMGVNSAHDQALRTDFKFFGFDPANLVTIEQELVPGISVDEEGRASLLETEGVADAAGHLYALIQASRRGGFTTYSESGRPMKPMEMDALAYLSSRGGKILNIIRINDMDRHSTDIINGKALSAALGIFKEGFVNVIEGVSNPDGQKGGTGTTFGDPSLHVLTETHENSFPSLSRAFEAAMKKYLEKTNGRHPAYNAMRQWADLAATRTALKDVGGRIVFVPRSKLKDAKPFWYLGVDMPMGDLSLLTGLYKSRMFQFADANGQELLIHDMKTPEQISIGLRALLGQLEDPHIIAATRELATGERAPFL